KNSLKRSRLNELLERSRNHFVASLISGRSRTGKTWAAIDFSATCKKVAWYTVDSSDNDWHVFSHYFSSSIVRAAFGRDAKAVKLVSDDEVSQSGMSNFLVDLFAKTTEKLKERKMLVVLDDVHHVFDADWFGDFFNLLLYSMPPSIHLLILCRTKPRLP